MLQGLYPLNPQQRSAMKLLWSLEYLEAPTCMLQHYKLNLCSKTNISKTAWINAWWAIQIAVLYTILGGIWLSSLNIDKILGPKSWNCYFIWQEKSVIYKQKFINDNANVFKTNKLCKHKHNTKKTCPAHIYLFKV